MRMMSDQHIVQKWKYISRTYACLSMVILFLAGCGAEDEDPFIHWDTYKGDATSSSYSALDQINKENVHQLEVAWTYSSGDVDENSRTNMQTNPIIIDNILYGASPYLKAFALDAATGEEKWIFDPFEGQSGRGIQRGMDYWESGGDQRIFYTAGNWLYALDAQTGRPISEFGDKGRVNFNVGLRRDPGEISVTATSPGMVYEDLLIMGSATGESYGSPPGDIRAYDVRSGEIVWTFRTIPQPAELGSDTWEGMNEVDMQEQGGANNWAGMSLDPDRGIVYVPLGSPVYDFYGGNRPGRNLFGNSLLALEAATGEYVWHYQTVYHDLWDYDLPAPPNLLTIERNGETMDVVAQVTKQGFIFVLDRDTGEPVFPIEERPVPSSTIESEQPWPVQPFPVQPESFVRQEFTEDLVTDLFPEQRDSMLAVYRSYHYEGLFTPSDPGGAIIYPSTWGASNWGGAAHNPNTGVLFVNANERPEVSTVQRVVEESASDGSLYNRGAAFYRQNCAMCHGASREGQHPIHPPLIDLAETSSKKDVLNIIVDGGGRMPAFPAMSKQEKEAIIAYLFDEEDAEGVSSSSSSDSVEENSEPEGQYLNVTAYREFRDAKGYPAIQPPWGTLNAIDLNSGKIKWKVLLGEYDELTEQGIPQTGAKNIGGPVATAGGLIFIGATEDKKFRAFDQENGDLLWETDLHTGGFATPSTYMVDDKQYIVIAAGGGRGTPSSDMYIAFSLPDN